MRRTNDSKRQKGCRKVDEEVDLMIIYFRLTQSCLIYSTLTSPSWGNGEVVLGVGVAQSSGAGQSSGGLR